MFPSFLTWESVFFRVPPKATPKSFVYPQLLKAQVRYAVEPRGILRSRFSSTAQSFGCSWTGRSTATEFGVRKLWVPPSDLKERLDGCLQVRTCTKSRKSCNGCKPRNMSKWSTITKACQLRTLPSRASQNCRLHYFMP